MEDERVDGDRLLVHGLPLVEADAVLGVEHPDLAADPARDEDVGRLVADLQRRPREGVEVFSAKKTINDKSVAISGNGTRCIFGIGTQPS